MQSTKVPLAARPKVGYSETNKRRIGFHRHSEDVGLRSIAVVDRVECFDMVRSR